MKNILYSLSILVLIVSCGTETKNTTITGTIKGLKKGTLYLQHINDTVLATKDSLQIDGSGNFTFNTELESPELLYLYLDKKDGNTVNDRLPFFAEPGTITIQTSWDSFDKNPKITGSQSHEKLEEFKKIMSKNNLRALELMQMGNNTNGNFSPSEIDSISALYTKNIQRNYLYAINFAFNNKNSYIAPYIAVKEIPEANIKYLDSIATVLPDSVANSKYGRELAAFVAKNKK